MHREESVLERQTVGRPEHEKYEELCALAAGGLLESSEIIDFRDHLKGCRECRSDFREFSSLVAGELPQGQGTLRQRMVEMRAKPLPESRLRFLARARAEGVVLSREVETPVQSGRWNLRSFAKLAPIAALVVVAVSLAVYHFRATPNGAYVTDAAATQQIAELKRENSALTLSLSRLSESVAASQREIRNLRSQFGTETLRRSGTQSAGNLERSTSQNAQLQEESRNGEKLLAEARAEAAHSSQLRVADEAAMVEQQARITELTNKLRIASATLDQERQLAAAGTDLRELMAARQLHVIDVRDTDSDGNHRKAFGRVFLTEGKSLTFYAFDLNEDSVLDAKRSFEVWATPQTGKHVSRSLGLLHVDAKSQGRWVLRVANPELVKEINSVFVTAEPSTGGKQPSGQKMLYAYLGQANHL
jgi:predicted  nucleic acid-binding Zn-ribbon protein